MGVILYKVDTIMKDKKINDICREIGCVTRKLTNENLNTEFGRLAGISYKNPVAAPNSPAATAKAPVMYNMPECILFAGLSDDMLDEFLAAYKAEGLSPIALKAVMTPSNVKWTLFGLLCELQKEADGIMKKNTQ